MKTSIITVCYNSNETIEQTIQSVLAQEYDDLEYIIIDGGSTDGTLNTIEKYGDKISVCISEKDHGIYDAMNKGVQNATGDIVAFLNSDDWYATDVLKKVNRYFEDSKVDMVSGNIYLYGAEGSKKLILDRAEKENVFFRLCYPQPALFIKRKLFLEIGKFDTFYEIAADTEWIIRACIAGANIMCVDDFFTYFRDSGISSQKAYQALKEQYRAALVNARENQMLQMEKRIKDFYREDLKHIAQMESVQKILKQKKEAIKALFDYDRKYYIWGAGIRGKECLEIFEQLDICIKGFIDSNKKQETEKKFPIFKPTEIKSDSEICITPKGYEKVIANQLEELGISRKRFFTFQELLDRIVSLGGMRENQEK